MPLRTITIQINPDTPTAWTGIEGTTAIQLVAGLETRVVFKGASPTSFAGIHSFRLLLKLQGSEVNDAALVIRDSTSKTDAQVVFDLSVADTGLPYQGLQVVLHAKEESGDPWGNYAWRDLPLLRPGSSGRVPLPRFGVGHDGAPHIVWTQESELGPLPPFGGISVQSVKLSGLADQVSHLNYIVGVADAVINSASARLNLPGFVQEFYGSTLPAGWLWCDGTAVSRTTYADLFTALGSTYGAGDGSTTFNLPDKRGRTAIGRDDMGGASAGRILVSLNGNITSGQASITSLAATSGLAVGMHVFGAGIQAGSVITSIDSGTAITISVNASATTAGVALTFSLLSGTSLGATGGSHVHALTEGQLKAHRHFIAASGEATVTLTNANQMGQFRTNTSDSGDFNLAATASTDATLGRTSATGGDQAHPNLPPVLVCNFIIKT